ncbi:hypothetical protein HanIR_Chr03g0148061 [Helianthus annuus]|nr:hypothetical protein HanIR_Chr03g0148061 [Helianthus annuus]
MGGSKIVANLARFAKEIAGLVSDGKDKAVGNDLNSLQPPVAKFNQNIPVVDRGKGKLFSDLFKNDNQSSDVKFNSTSESGKIIEIADNTLAFRDLIGNALVGRCKDLGILRKSLSYLGGLSMLLKFESEDSCSKFLLDNQIWCSWFSSLDLWNGQSLPFERLAWIRINGVPMHLADNDVLNNIAEHYGKIVHGSELEAEDGNLSVSWIGLLVGDGERIRDFITLKWSNKLFRVWIEEEFSDWVPESVGVVSGRGVDLAPPTSSSDGSSNVNGVSGDGGELAQGTQSGLRLDSEK